MFPCNWPRDRLGGPAAGTRVPLPLNAVSDWIGWIGERVRGAGQKTGFSKSFMLSWVIFGVSK